MYAAISVVFFALGITCVRSYPGFWTNQDLTPVHGLYVKRSSDGATGDLFVAATEDSGVKSQWVVDQPINFLNIAAATQPPAHAHALPVAYPGFTTTQDESSTQKRAVMPSPVPSSPVQYAYAVPVPSSESNPVASYSYAYSVPSTTPDTSAPKCDPTSTATHYPFQFPFQFFYPQMMSAYSNAMTILKDAGLSEETANSAIAQASPSWPPSPYGYPMYVMMSPSVCTQTQSATTPSTSTSSPSTQEEESTQP